MRRLTLPSLLLALSVLGCHHEARPRATASTLVAAPSLSFYTGHRRFALAPHAPAEQLRFSVEGRPVEVEEVILSYADGVQLPVTHRLSLRPEESAPALRVPARDQPLTHVAVLYRSSAPPETYATLRVWAQYR
ncbi:MAG: hypothetical protein KC731_09065 [Myxococcales bacterium]|nr:hypothetical protein [Myxococcales bacterium]